MKVLGTLLFLSIVVALLGSTSWSNDSIATDGYVFERKEFTNSQLQVNIIYYGSLAELRLEARIREYQGSEMLLAFAENYHDYCEIHVVDPRVEYHPERYGHELMHCVHGNWHSQQVVFTYED